MEKLLTKVAFTNKGGGITVLCRGDIQFLSSHKNSQLATIK